MFCQRILCSFVALFFVESAVANLFLPELVSADHYQSGPQICDPESSFVKGEHGFFISVPRHQNSVHGDMISLYVHTEKEFNPAMPSVVIFDGGPGLASHDEIFSSLTSWNVIRFDQRGVGCSRPASYKAYRDLAVYSSESTARDADEVRRALKISKWAVYGSSYGTVPATMYASRFATATLSLTVEGVVAAGGDALWSGPQRRRLLQRLLNGLPTALLQVLNQFAAKYQVPDYWFSAFSQRQMASNHGLEALRAGLLDFSRVEERIAKEFRAASLGVPAPRTRDEILSLEDPLVFAALACRELGLAHEKTALYDSLRGGKLSPSYEVSPAKTVCAPLGIMDDATKLYSAAPFPVRAPVTYFQGAEDGQTDSDFAWMHFKSARRGPGQVLLLRHGGHTPGQDILAEPGPQQDLQRGLLLKALRGERIEATDMRQFNQAGDEHWDLTVSPVAPNGDSKLQTEL